MHVDNEQLKKFILDAGLISRADFEAVEAESKQSGVALGKVIIKQGRISEDDLRRIQGHVLGIPFVDLKGQKIDMPVLSLVPEPIARTHNIVAFRKTETTLEVAM